MRRFRRFRYGQNISAGSQWLHTPTPRRRVAWHQVCGFQITGLGMSVFPHPGVHDETTLWKH